MPGLNLDLARDPLAVVRREVDHTLELVAQSKEESTVEARCDGVRHPFGRVLHSIAVDLPTKLRRERVDTYA
jgi:hypothetical protein